MVVTSLDVELAGGRHRVRMRHGPVRAQPLHGPGDRARIALVGQTALLLGGDRVELDIRVGPGARLELTEVAGTVAYDGRGHAASWCTRIRLATGAELVWAGEPFVISDGADVTRETRIEAAGGATAALRETLVLGRSGEAGGRLRSRTAVFRDERPVLLEDLLLDPVDRRGPGLLGSARVLDSLLELGLDHPGDPDDRPAAPSGTARFRLAEPGARLTRYLGAEAAASPLARPRMRAAMLAE
ncbi:MAG TPA: urease accessory protein UreD [Microlunatus sp.]|nr:urease accessory protein UreD [Microlunatus sp.]